MSEQWISELETGIIELDRENRTLMRLIDQVVAASQTSDLAILRRAIENLQNQARTDFAREDRLMDALRYEGSSQHKGEHRQLLEEIQHQIDDLNAGSTHIPSILRFQKNWVTHHIAHQDFLLGQAMLTHKGICERRLGQPQSMTEDELDAFEDRRQGILEQIIWTDRMAVGVVAMDVEHRALVELCNQIIETSQSRDRTRLAALLAQFGDATAEHFEAEHKLMTRFNYEHSESHLKEHQELLREYGHQVDDWRANLISADYLCRFMYRWLLRHISTDDRLLGEAIKRQGGNQACLG